MVTTTSLGDVFGAKMELVPVQKLKNGDLVHDVELGDGDAVISRKAGVARIVGVIASARVWRIYPDRERWLVTLTNGMTFRAWSDASCLVTKR